MGAFLFNYLVLVSDEDAMVLRLCLKTQPKLSFNSSINQHYFNQAFSSTIISCRAK